MPSGHCVFTSSQNHFLRINELSSTRCKQRANFHASKFLTLYSTSSSWSLTIFVFVYLGCFFYIFYFLFDYSGFLYLKFGLFSENAEQLQARQEIAPFVSRNASDADEADRRTANGPYDRCV